VPAPDDAPVPDGEDMARAPNKPAEAVPAQVIGQSQASSTRAFSSPSRVPVAQISEPVVPRNADDVLHNAIVRQLSDEIQNPPAEEPVNPALQTLSQIMLARQAGQPLAPLQEDIARQTVGLDVANKTSWHLYRRYRTDKLVLWLLADDRVDQLLFRMFKRGDFSTTEALVLKKLCQTNIRELADELLAEIQSGAPEFDAGEAMAAMDYTVQVTEREGQNALVNTTPQGREIVRKLIFSARQKLFPKK